jgi:hypothetical protein
MLASKPDVASIASCSSVVAKHVSETAEHYSPLAGVSNYETLQLKWYETPRIENGVHCISCSNMIQSVQDGRGGMCDRARLHTCRLPFWWSTKLNKVTMLRKAMKG